MTLSESISKTHRALKYTTHKVCKIQYNDILELLIELRDKVENFNTQVWYTINHELYDEYTDLAGTPEENEAEEDIVEFLLRYENDLQDCITKSNPTEREARLVEGWDPRI